jgi:hypothetical protein
MTESADAWALSGIGMILGGAACGTGVSSVATGKGGGTNPGSNSGGRTSSSVFFTLGLRLISHALIPPSAKSSTGTPHTQEGILLKKLGSSGGGGGGAAGFLGAEVPAAVAVVPDAAAGLTAATEVGAVVALAAGDGADAVTAEGCDVEVVAPEGVTTATEVEGTDAGEAGAVVVEAVDEDDVVAGFATADGLDAAGVLATGGATGVGDCKAAGISVAASFTKVMAPSG